MTDTSLSTTPTTTDLKTSARDSGSQAWVAFTIVICVTLIAVCALALAKWGPTTIAVAAVGIASMVVGGLINALQAPSGIGAVISSALGKKSQEPTPK